MTGQYALMMPVVGFGVLALPLGCNDCYFSKHLVQTRFTRNLIVCTLRLFSSNNKEDKDGEWRGTPLLSIVHTTFLV